MRQTLVLNADYRPIVIVPWQRGISLVMEGKATQVDFYSEGKVRDGKGRQYPVPAVVALVKYIHRDFSQVPFGRKNVLIRDKLTCQYCRKRFEPGELTLDHVVPRSKWAKPTTPTCWENVVASCFKCNNKKGNMSCSQANMFPMTPPCKPPYGESYLGINPFRRNTPQEWLPYLSSLPSNKGNNNVKEIQVSQ